MTNKKLFEIVNSTGEIVGHATYSAAGATHSSQFADCHGEGCSTCRAIQTLVNDFTLFSMSTMGGLYMVRWATK